MKNTENKAANITSYRVHNYGVPGSLTPIDKSLWGHPMLTFYKEPELKKLPEVPAKLYLVPTPEYFGRGLFRSRIPCQAFALI